MAASKAANMAVHKERQAMNLVKLIEQYGSDERCRTYLEHLRWPEGVRCINCGSDSISRIKTRNQLDCNACRTRFSVTSGTVFHDSHLPLWKWFLAVYMMGEAKKGVSANQLKRTLGVAYKTAWYLCHRIRYAMGLTDDGAPLGASGGIVETDETFVGGKAKGKGHKAGWKNKTMVMGVLERGGDVRLQVGTKATKAVVRPFVQGNVAGDAAAIYSDEATWYGDLADGDTAHNTVRHSLEEWVVGDVHSNGIEGVWSLFKRSVIGSYHQLSVKHLPAYLDEFEFRFNNRENPYLFRDTLLALIAGERLTYAALTEPAE